MPVRSLSGLKILDLSEYASGPYCTKMFTGWGAEVLKVEKPGCGDIARTVGTFPHDEPHPEKSALFLYLNTGKKSITLNLKNVIGVKILKELIKNTDVLIENFEPGIMSGLGLAYETLKKINPGLVMTSISGFGQTGPYRNFKAKPIVEYALGGQLYIGGQLELEPIYSTALLPDYMGGLYGFSGTMLALTARNKTGNGQHVDVSMMECMAGAHQFALTWPEYSGQLLERPGWNAPVLPCKDGYVIYSCVRTEIALSATLADRPELAEDPRFETRESRSDHEMELEAILSEGFKNHTRKEILDACALWREICGSINTVDEVLDNPQYKDRGFWAEIDHPCTGKLTYPGNPAKMTETGFEVQRAPLLGEHNEEIYRERLHYSREDIVRLREDGVI
ncbi:MAG: CoA transferase [Dehalococcoidales bacterium]|nr:CoA transferase [Dehalococcoidales bacterium]